MLVHRLRRWNNVKQTLVKRLVSAGRPRLRLDHLQTNYSFSPILCNISAHQEMFITTSVPLYAVEYSDYETSQERSRTGPTDNKHTNPQQSLDQR